MITPSLEEARALAAGYTLLPISLEMFSDSQTPIEILKTLKSHGRNAFILESVESGESWGRYTFLGFDPSATISGNGTHTIVRRSDNEEVHEGNPHQVLKALAQGYRSPRMAHLPPFSGGFVGYFAYEYARYVEPNLHLTAKDAVGIDDFCLMLFDKIVAIDHFRQKIYLIVNIDTADLAQSYARGVEQLQAMACMIHAGPREALPAARVTSEWQASFSKEAFCNVVEKVKAHIVEGDIFQCVPSIRMQATYEGDLLQAYRALRTINPSSYMFYLEFEHMQIAGASPETLVSLKDGILSTYPLAGTCKRLDDEAATERLIAALLADEKELSEHDMLVDLSRNDLGKISEFGSVKVEEYRKVKKCSHVCHISSKVTGQLKSAYDAFDAISAVIPAGTLSGAPKKRAMEIIDDAEQQKRGVYGGAVGYIDFSGNMDLCIGIRMALLKDKTVYVQAGAGIVADSVPEKEYEECMNKARAMLNAIAKDVRL